MSNEGGLMAVGAFFLVVGAFDLFRARAFRDYCLRFLEIIRRVRSGEHTMRSPR